ncbi:MAG: helix-hairpin-helix domain-containing protein [Reichenbachiella sp.]
MKRALTTLVTSIAVVSALHAQEPQRPDIDIQSFVEQMFQVPDEDLNYDDLYESLYQLYLNPIDLNNTNANELNSLYQIDILQTNNLLDYLDKHDPMLSIYELQVINGFDSRTIEAIRPFVVVKSPGDRASQGNLMQRITHEENTYLLLRTEMILEEKKGFKRSDSGGYLGSPQKLYGRFQSSHSKDFSIGLTFEKDAGERITWNPNQNQYGFDYYSFHIALKNKGHFKTINIGDYQMQFGQGLVVGSGFNPGKGAETITTVKRGNTGIRPYSSVLESGFMRGAAFTYTLGHNIDISPFYSRINQDANIKVTNTSNSVKEYISSIQNIGFHRTYTELNNRKQITEQSYGLNITYNHTQSRNFQAGLTWINTHYATPIKITPVNYRAFEFEGSYNYNLGLFTNYNWRNFLFFGEAAISKSGGWAYLAGFMGSLSPIISTSFSVRNYNKNYHSFYGSSFGEGSRSINEMGLYWGLKVSPSRKIILSAYYDYFIFPWLRYRVDAPSDGYEYLVKADFRPNKKVNLYVQYRQQSKALSINIDNQNLKSLEEGIKRSISGNISANLHANIGLKSRVQYSNYEILTQRTQGFSMTQDVNIKISKFKISTRFAIFDTEDYENRQYNYEKDLLYAFSIPAYAGNGTRNYIMLQYKLNRKLTLWAKYGRYNFKQVNAIGSGNETILGNQKSEIKFQIRYKL